MLLSEGQTQGWSRRAVVWVGEGHGRIATGMSSRAKSDRTSLPAGSDGRQRFSKSAGRARREVRGLPRNMYRGEGKAVESGAGRRPPRPDGTGKRGRELGRRCAVLFARAGVGRMTGVFLSWGQWSVPIRSAWTPQQRQTRWRSGWVCGFCGGEQPPCKAPAPIRQIPKPPTDGHALDVRSGLQRYLPGRGKVPLLWPNR